MGTGSDDNHDIDTAGVNYVYSIIRGRDWELCKPDPDRMGIDGLVVLKEARRPIHPFKIQIKSRGARVRAGKAQPLVNRQGFVTQSMEIEHLEFYMRLTEPMFLFVVDTINKQGYWLFLQRYIKEKLKDRDWLGPLHKHRQGKRKTAPKIDIHVPGTNLLADVDALKKAVKDACGYMASLGIPTGIKYEVDALKDLDPRFDISLDIVGGKKDFKLHPKEDVTIKFGVPSEKADDLFGRGLPVELAPGELVVDGSPIWEQLATKGGTLQFSKDIQGSVNLRRLSATGTVLGQIDAIPCIFQGGPLELRFSCSLPHDLMKVQGVITFQEGMHHQFTVTTDVGAWYKRRLSQLPFFGPMEAFVCGAKVEDRLELEFFLPGTRLGSAIPKGSGETLFFHLNDIITPLTKAREIGRLFGVDSMTPNGFSHSDLEDLEVLYEVIQGREVRDTTHFTKVTIQVATSEAKKLGAATNDPVVLGEFKGTTEMHGNLFGELIRVPGVTNRMTNVRIEWSLPTSASRNARRFVKLAFVPTELTVQTVRGPEGGYIPSPAG